MSKQNTNKITPKRDLAKFMVIFASLLIIIIGIKSIASQLLAPILLAVFFAILLNPLFKLFKKEGRPSWISLSLTLVTLLVSFFAIVLIVTISFSQLSNNLDNYIFNITENIQQISGRFGIESSVSEITRSLLNEENITSLARTVISNMGNIFTILFFVPLAAVLLLLQSDSYMRSPIKSSIINGDTIEKLSRFSKSITIYVTGRAKVNLFTGSVFFVFLFILNIDFAILWGMLMVLLSFVPYIGATIASIPAIVIALAIYGWVGAFIVILGIFIINLIAENLLEPYIQSKGNKLSAIVVVTALFFWVWLFGPIGAILSVPLTVLMKIIFEEFDETRWLSSLMEGDFERTSKEIEKNNVFTQIMDSIRNRI